MRKINLKAKNLPGNQQGKNQLKGSSLVIGTILLILAAGLYGGVFYLKSVQEKKVIALKSQIQVLKNDLDKNKNYKELYNFQDKLLEIGGIFKDKVIQVNVLSQISEATINESTLQGLKITMNDGSSNIDLTSKITDLNILAKQLNAYSQIDTNGQAILKTSSLGEEGVEASMKFTVDILGESVDTK